MTAPATARERVVEIARAELGSQAKGSPEVYGYWRDVLPATWSNAQVKQYAATKEWCGGFVLWCLHRAGLALDVHWQDGLGFLGPARLPRTATPLPGDVAYLPQPYQHHAVVESLTNGTLITIDGNQPGVTRKIRPAPPKMIYYSIAPFLIVGESPAAIPALERPTVRVGSNGAAVLALQTRLRAAGHYSGALDGIYGPRTAEAVRSFQRAAGLVVDGIAGPITWSALE